MLLQLDDNHKLTLDSSRQNIQLEQLQTIKNKKEGGTKSSWEIIGFHGLSLRSALFQYMKELIVSDDKLETIHNVLDRLNEIEKTIVKVVKQENIQWESQDDK
jgi:hypothetical protein